MNAVPPQRLAEFARQFRFSKGRLLSVHLRSSKHHGIQAIIHLKARTAIRSLADRPQMVRLRFVLSDVQEYRFQKRPHSDKRILQEVQFAYLDNLIYINFDAWEVEPGEKLGVFEIRGSEAFIAGRSLAWEQLPPKKT